MIEIVKLFFLQKQNPQGNLKIALRVRFYLKILRGSVKDLISKKDCAFR
jgi:hypothetical protein